MRIANLTVQIFEKGEWKTLNKTKFKFGIGDEVVFHFFSRQSKVKIVGYDGDNYVIKLDEDSYLSAARGQISPLKKKDRLNAGDKFIDNHRNHLEVLFVYVNDSENTLSKVNYFCKIIGEGNAQGQLVIHSPVAVNEIIYE